MKEKQGKILIFFTLASSIVYLTWRAFFTLPIGFGVISMIAGIILLIAEVSGTIEMMLHFKGMSHINKLKLPKAEPKDYPTVDVFIATYNEPEELLYKTINGCIHMKYPDTSKVSIYLCDDGNRSEIKELADRFGIGYLAREDHKGAKAGNLNHALAHSSGDLVVTLDADMIPMSDFLISMVPYFIPDLIQKKKLERTAKDKVKDRKHKIGFVQAPQSFYNLDLFQYNLYSEQSIPNEQDYFYKNIQLSKNSTNSVIYGGSNTILSREALNEIGGFVTDVITEDFATGMLIESCGYAAIAIDEVHASGLSPEDLESLIKQRRRWARGCIQTGRKLSILFRKGLTLRQKISYQSSINYWYSSIKRLVYMLAPIMYSIFGITVLHTNSLLLLIFWLPMQLITSYTLRKMSGNIRTLRWTNIYETIMFPLLLKDVVLEMIGISQHKFVVTRKGKPQANQKYQIKMAIPHMIFALATLYGLLHSIYIIFATGNVSLLFLMFWLCVNMYNLIMALFFMLGRPAVRMYSRFRISADVKLSYTTSQTYEMNAVTHDISEGGFSFMTEQPVYLPPEAEFTASIRTPNYQAVCKAEIVQVSEMKNGYKYACRIIHIEENDYQQLLCILHDRVPPLTMQVDTEHGFVDDLRTNVIKRREHTVPLHRKLPRIKTNEQVMLPSSELVTITSYNFRYITLTTKSGEIDPKLERLDLTPELTLHLHLERVLTYDERKSGLYAIENYDELLQQPQMNQWMLTVYKKSKQMWADDGHNAEGIRKKVCNEFDELQLL